MSFLKSKAVFMIFILLIALFTVSILPSTDARQNACCEKTTTGQYCQYTALANCDTNYQTSPTKCEQTSFCQPICCVTPQDGLCYTQTAASQCAAKGGIIDAQNPDCNTQQCAQGCCNLGNSYFLTTENNCKIRAQQFPNIDSNTTFDASVTDEQTCIDKGRQQDQGCCVSGALCSFMAQAACKGVFHSDTFCSDPTLSCGCTPQAQRICIAGEDDVYWTDSCGNKESVAEDCDYSQGTLCQDRGTGASCQSVDCAKTAAIPNNPHDSKIGAGGPRKNGESWCSYESPVGDWLDRPGSRHYRHVCVNGQELISECRDLRQEICVQASTPTGEAAANCLPHNIYNSQITSNVTTVPQGGRFWDGSNKDQCSKGTISCTVAWAKKNQFDDWDCEQNCHCEDPSFIDQMATYCASQGDCGANFNIFDQPSSSGLSVSWKGSGRGNSPTQLTQLFWGNRSVFGVFGGMIGLQQTMKDFLIAGISANTQDFHGGALLIGAAVVIAYFTIIIALTEGVTLSAALVSLFTEGLATLAGVGASLPIIGWVIAAIAIIISIVLGGGKTATKTITVTCAPWVAPTGGSDCSKCSDDPRYQASAYTNPVLCDEYRCRSLGASCELVNDGTGKPFCVDIQPNDVSSPIITPWQEVLSQGFTAQPTSQGYLIQPDAPAYTPLTFGIHTDEAAQCKLATTHTNTFDEMTSYFETSLYALDHNITLLLPEGQDYAYYVRCQDKKGNFNAAEYTIQFRTQTGPDIQPPVIEGTSLSDGAFLPATANQTVFTLFLNEPADSCRWSNQDQDMNSMPAENLFICDSLTQQPTTSVSYTCTGALTGIQTNTQNTFYFRCRDLAGNEQQQSAKITLQGTAPLIISSAGPSGELFTDAPVLQIATAGGAEQGKAICTYQSRGYSAVQFFSTDSSTHSQPLQDLTTGSYDYTIQCRDAAGNAASTALSFAISVDTDAPAILNLYSDGTMLYLVTDETATCSASTTSSFSFDDGALMAGGGSTQHTLTIQEQKYFIQCRDQYQNTFSSVTVYL